MKCQLPIIFICRPWCCLLSMFCMLCPLVTQAAAYQLFPTASSVARSLAGNGLLEQEASGLVFNAASPALQQKTPQLELGVSYISHDLHLQNNGSKFINVVNGSIFNTPIPGTDGHASGTAVIPGIFYTAPVSQHPGFSWGAGFSAPYGLDTEYNPQWVGRYQALLSSLEILELDLVMSYQLGSRWMLGAGLSVQKAEVELTQAVPLSPIQDAISSVEASSHKQGFTAGLIYQPNPNLRLGLSYRNRVSHDFSGSQKIFLPTTVLSNSPIRAPLTVPETLLFSISYAPIAARWSLASAIRHTSWSRFENLELKYADGSSKAIPQLWHNSFTYSVAFDYKLSDKQQVVFSLASDLGPVPNAQLRGARIPDANRNIFGFGYEISNTFCQSCAVLMAYHHTLTGSRYINHTEDFKAGFGNELNGKYSSTAADVMAISLTIGF